MSEQIKMTRLRRNLSAELVVERAGISKAMFYADGANKRMFGVFEDSCPNRWGRLWMKRHEAIITKKQKKENKSSLHGLLKNTGMHGTACT